MVVSVGASVAVTSIAILLAISLYHVRSIRRWKAALETYAQREMARNRRLDAYAAWEGHRNRQRKAPLP